MALHLIAYDASDAANTTLTQLTAIATEFETISNNGVVIGSWPLIIAAWAYSAHLQRAQFRAPSLQSPDYPLISPVMVARATSSIDLAINDWRGGPPNVKVGESLLAFEQHITATEHVYIAALLADKVPTPVQTAFRTVQLTGTTTLVADTFTAVSMSFTDQLPYGNYDVIGARFESASGVLCRLGVPGLGYRPGFPCVLDAVTRDHAMFRNGGLGAWFTFLSTQQITAEVLATAADTAETLYLDLVGPH